MQNATKRLFGLQFLGLITAVIFLTAGTAFSQDWSNSAPKGIRKKCADDLRAQPSSIEILSQRYNSKHLANTTVGEENEGHVKRPMSRIDASVVVSKFLSARFGEKNVERYYNDADANSNDVWEVLFHTPDKRSHIVQVKNDQSIAGKTNYLDVEVTSPIMYDQGDYDLYDDILTELQRHSFQADSVAGGLHYHIGFDNYESAEVAVLILVYDLIHEELFKIIDVSPERATYAKRFNPALIEQIQAVANSFTRGERQHARWIIGLATDSNISEGRNHGLNVTNLGENKLKTVEFRIANSTLNRKIRHSLRDFFKKLVLAVRNKDSKVLNLAIEAQKSKTKLPLEAIFQALNLNYDDFLEAFRF